MDSILCQECNKCLFYNTFRYTIQSTTKNKIMTKEDTKKAIEVMQAYVDGAEIERLTHCDDWIYVRDPEWNWITDDYRVRYIPYDDVLEVQRDKFVKNKYYTTTLYSILEIDKKSNKVHISGMWYTLKEFFGRFEYGDGTPCGKISTK